MLVSSQLRAQSHNQHLPLTRHCWPPQLPNSWGATGVGGVMHGVNEVQAQFWRLSRRGGGSVGNDL